MNKKTKDYIILFIKYVILITFCLLINSLFKNYLIENFDCNISKKEFCKDKNMCCSKYKFCNSKYIISLKNGIIDLKSFAIYLKAKNNVLKPSSQFSKVGNKQAP